MVYCPECISFGIDCNPDEEDYEKDCSRYEKADYFLAEDEYFEQGTLKEIVEGGGNGK